MLSRRDPDSVFHPYGTEGIAPWTPECGAVRLIRGDGRECLPYVVPMQQA